MKRKTNVNPKKQNLIYSGKAKKIYSVAGDDDLLWLQFTDDLTAFNGKKKSSFAGKGALNRDISSLVFQYLRKENILNHWVSDQNHESMICRRLKMQPLEVVVRNRLSGSTARKFQFPEGKPLPHPLVEFYYKDDKLQDPFLSQEQAVVFGYLKESEWGELKTLALQVNQKLLLFFDQAGIELVDFKMEFGHREGKWVLGDELSCDSCRLWDKASGNRMDKDRFRLGLEQIKESYQEVLMRLLKRGKPDEGGG